MDKVNAEYLLKTDEDFKQAKAITDNQVNLCLSCENRYPECGAENVIFGDGVGHDNICCCNKYKALLMRDQVIEILYKHCGGENG